MASVAAGPAKSGRHKGINFELNLIPFIDMLSTCICFLLMTTVFIQLGTIDTKQALGNETASGGANTPSLFVKMSEDGTVNVALKDIATATNAEREYNIQGVAGNQVDWPKAMAVMAQLHQTYPQVETALVLPAEKSKYKDMIRVMDELKKNLFKNVGISPL